MSDHIKCEHEVDDLARAMVREGAGLDEIIASLRDYWFAEWTNERDRMAKKFNSAQDAMRVGR